MPKVMKKGMINTIDRPRMDEWMEGWMVMHLNPAVSCWQHSLDAPFCHYTCWKLRTHRQCVFT